MTEKRYTEILRAVTVVVAIGMWLASIVFNVEGFNFNLTGYSLLGWFLGFAITVIQLVWNRESNANWTIMIVGIIAYGYGIYMNVVGIATAQGVVLGVDESLVFPLLLGFFLEVTPEALLVWGLTGSANLGDFFGNLMDSQQGRGKSYKGGRGKPKPTRRPEKPIPPPRRRQPEIGTSHLLTYEDRA